MLILSFKKNNERGEDIICKRENWIHLAIVVETFTISWLLDSDPGSIYFLLLTFYRDQRWYWRRGGTMPLSGSGHTFTTTDGIHIVKLSGCW